MEPVSIVLITFAVTSGLIKLTRYLLDTDTASDDTHDFAYSLQRLAEQLQFLRQLRIQYRHVMTLPQRVAVLDQEASAWDSVWCMERKIRDRFGVGADGSLRMKSRKDGQAILAELRDDLKDARSAATTGILALQHQMVTVNFVPELRARPALAAGITHSIMVHGSSGASASPAGPTTPVSASFARRGSAKTTPDEWTGEDVLEAAERFGSLVVSALEAGAAIAEAVA